MESYGCIYNDDHEYIRAWTYIYYKYINVYTSVDHDRILSRVEDCPVEHPLVFHSRHHQNVNLRALGFGAPTGPVTEDFRGAASLEHRFIRAGAVEMAAGDHQGL